MLPIQEALDPGEGSRNLPGKGVYMHALADLYLEIHPRSHKVALVRQSTEMPPLQWEGALQGCSG